MPDYIRWFEELKMTDVPDVGGKNASLGEMISELKGAGIEVPGGFATTSHAFREFLAEEGLDKRIEQKLQNLDSSDVVALAEAGSTIRQWILDTPLPAGLQQAVETAYAKLDDGKVSVAVRSSATAEDLPEASFAGQQETFLNVVGVDDVIEKMHHVFASLYNDRAISYRVHQGFEHSEVALSAGIQRMVRSDLAASGVMFSIDTESGFEDAVFITSSWGLGECVVQGSVNPDEFYVHKPLLADDKPAILRKTRGSKRIKMIFDSAGGAEAVKTVDVEKDDQQTFSLSDDDVLALARMAVTIEKHYGRPMDIEWGKDGNDGRLYILQARPETVESRSNRNVIRRYKLNGDKGKVLATGRSIGQRIGSGAVRVVPSLDQIASVQDGDILVTDMTDPDWEPVMKRAAAIVTNRGGRTCHAAIIARELGVPAVVGCGDATELLNDGVEVTVSCAEGDTGFVYDTKLEFEVTETELSSLPELPFKLTMNVGNPEKAFGFSQLPNAGIGLARLEFIISKTIGIHPKALLDYDSMPEDIKSSIDESIAGYKSPKDFYIDKIVEGVATLGAAFHPHPVIVRLSDFKSNEYANMVGGQLFEPDEENPMIGFRGASRYVSSSFQECFEMECLALKRVRDRMSLTNVELMVPFIRTLEEADQVLDLMKQHGLERGKNGLRIVMMCEVPSNAILAEEFLEKFDGFSIGSNDLTQLTLGLDRDSGLIAHLFDERDPAVKKLLANAIAAANKQGKYVGICGQGPSDHPDLAKWLMDQGISSLSLNPDTIIETWMFLAKPAA